MDPSQHGTVLLIWMLLSMSLGNCIVPQSGAWIFESRPWIPQSRAWNCHDSILGLPNIGGAIDETTNNHLEEQPSQKVTLAQSDFFNSKKFHSIVLQGVCIANRLFWNICAGQSGGVHDGGQFKASSLYKELRERSILQEPIVDVRGKMCIPYLIGDSTYPIWTYLQKNWKSTDDEGKKRYDIVMNSGRVRIEHIFGSLKNRWCILKSFNSTIERAACVSIACCWLHNYYELWNVPELERHTINRVDPHVGFGNSVLLVFREADRAKAEGEALRSKLYEQWIIQHPVD